MGMVFTLMILLALSSPLPYNTVMADAYIDIYLDRWAVVPEIRVPIKIDGLLDEEVWERAANLGDFISIYYGDEAEAPTSVKLLYDKENLYIGLICKYPEAGGPQSGEGVDVIISPDTYSQTYHHFWLGIFNYCMEIATALEPGKESSGQVVTETHLADDFWYAEMAIPFTILGEEGVQPGHEWRINLIRDRVNYVPITSWVRLRQSQHPEAPGGNARLNNGKRFVDEGRLGIICFGEELEEPWYPEDPLLEYKGYNQKVLSFTWEDMGDIKVKLEWRTPSGARVAIDDFKVSQNSHKLQVDFVHPKPYEKGLYGLDVHIQGGERKRLARIAFDDASMIEAGVKAQSHLTGLPEGKKGVSLVTPSSYVQELIDLIPDKTGLRECGIPDRPELRPGNLFTWNPSDPWKLSSSHTSLTYPNDKYPQDQVLKVRNPLGEVVEYPYYRAPNGKRYFLDACLWYHQRYHVIKEVTGVAERDPLGAARILYRFAQVYPGYSSVVDHSTRGHYPIEEVGPPYPYWGGLWDSAWFYWDSVRVASLAEAFRQVKTTDAFQKLSEEVGEDVEYKVEYGMIRPSVEYLRTYPTYTGNMGPTMWRGLIDIGKALNEPDYIHEVVQSVKTFLDTQFLFDGSWKEVTVSYHRQSIGGLSSTLDQLYGWSDPEGYVSPRTGMRFEKLDMAKDFPIIKRATEFSRYMAYPDGKYLPIQDTWAYQTTSNPIPGPVLMPAAGIARLSRGAGREESQVYLTFVPKYGIGHHHRDPLYLLLFAEGQELLPDIGYTYTNYRTWANSTLGHNTVAVDGKSMTTSGIAADGGNIQVFAPVDGTVQVMQASQETAYPVVDEYSREVWSIGISSKKGYVVDIFRVSGGSRHEYTLQGDANNSATYETDMSLEDYGPYLLPPGTQVVMPRSDTAVANTGGHYHAYAHVQDVKKAQIEDGRFHLTFVTEGGSKAKLKITGFLESGEVFLGKSPALTGIRVLKKDTNDLIDDYHMPKLVLRREGQDLRSTFVTVLEPYVDGFFKKGPTIERIEELKPNKSREGDVALVISWGNTKDFILSSSNPQEPLVVGDMVLNGKMGFIRTEKGRVKGMYLIGGTSLKIGDVELTSQGPAHGKILKVLRQEAGDKYDGLLTDTKVDQGFKGKYIVVTHPDGKTHGYEIKDIKEEGMGSLVILSMDPGFSFDSETTSSMKFLPFTQWRGEHTFRIENIEVK